MLTSANHWGVVILNWNGAEDTLACLRSVETAARACDSVTLLGIVVDNGSEPGSLTAVRAAVDSLDNWELLALDTNSGFSRGMNAGIKAMPTGRVSHVLLLNSDTLLAVNAFTALAAMQGHRPSELTGLAVKASGERRCLAGYRYYPWLGMARPVYLTPSDSTASPHIDYVCGSAMLIAVALIERIGGIPERSFLYFEELRLAKALLPGEHPRCCPAAEASHSAGQSAGKLTQPSRHYFAAHACYRYTLDFGALKLPTVVLARLVRLLQASFASRSARPLGEGLLALWDCLSGVERRPS